MLQYFKYLNRHFSFHFPSMYLVNFLTNTPSLSSCSRKLSKAYLPITSMPLSIFSAQSFRPLCELLNFFLANSLPSLLIKLNHTNRKAKVGLSKYFLCLLPLQPSHASVTTANAFLSKRQRYGNSFAFLWAKIGRTKSSRNYFLLSLVLRLLSKPGNLELVYLFSASLNVTSSVIYGSFQDCSL